MACGWVGPLVYTSQGTWAEHSGRSGPDMGSLGPLYLKATSQTLINKKAIVMLTVRVEQGTTLIGQFPKCRMVDISGSRYIWDGVGTRMYIKVLTSGDHRVEIGVLVEVGHWDQVESFNVGRKWK